MTSFAINYFNISNMYTLLQDHITLIDIFCKLNSTYSTVQAWMKYLTT